LPVLVLLLLSNEREGEVVVCPLAGLPLALNCLGTVKAVPERGQLRIQS